MEKKTIFAIIFLFTIIFTVGCNKNKKESTTTNTVTTTAEHVHEFGSWIELSKPTCSEEGFRKRVCSCGISETEILPRTEHTFSNDKCDVCNYERLTEGFSIYYSQIDNMYHINDYNGDSKTVRIPYLYDDGTNGEHKIYIDKNSVDDAYESTLKNAKIEKIIIGSGYQTIEKNTFLGLNNLMEVVIESENVTQIGDNAFYNCPKLSKITFVNTIEKIGFYAFAGCDFKEIELPYNLKILGNGVFSDNENLSKITYYNLNEIGDNAFSNTALSEIRIPYTLSYFGFQGKMSSLTKFTIDARNTIFEYSNGCLINKETNSLVKCISSSVSIPENIVELYPYSLSYLDFSDIAKVVIPESVKYVGFRAFYNTKLSDIDLGKIEEIDENSLSNIIFVDSDSISIVLPETLKQIEYHAFQNLVCNEVVIPISVTKVGSAIFEGCKVTSIKIHSTTTKLDDCDDNWDYGIDDTITTIYIIDD